MFKMQPVEFKKVFNLIKLWQCAGERAPHKSLLFLNALGSLKRGDPS
jgi:hypothetical protein